MDLEMFRTAALFGTEKCKAVALLGWGVTRTAREETTPKPKKKERTLPETRIIESL